GPVVLALYLGGIALSNSMAQARRQPLLMSWDETRKLGLVLGACVVATLVSPHHIYAYTLPSELSPTVNAALKGNALRWFFVGPWDADYFRDTPWNGMKDPASYYVLLRGAYHVLAVVGLGSLLVLGLVSFVGRQISMRWELVLPTLFLFGLSCV